MKNSGPRIDRACSLLWKSEKNDTCQGEVFFKASGGPTAHPLKEASSGALRLIIFVINARQAAVPGATAIIRIAVMSVIKRT